MTLKVADQERKKGGYNSIKETPSSQCPIDKSPNQLTVNQRNNKTVTAPVLRHQTTHNLTENQQDSYDTLQEQ